MSLPLPIPPVASQDSTALAVPWGLQQTLVLLLVVCSVMLLFLETQTQSTGKGRRRGDVSAQAFICGIHCQAPPALLQVLLLPQFLLFPVPRPLSVPDKGHVPWWDLSRSLLLAFALPTSCWVLIPKRAPVPHEASSSAGCL